MGCSVYRVRGAGEAASPDDRSCRGTQPRLLAEASGACDSHPGHHKQRLRFAFGFFGRLPNPPTAAAGSSEGGPAGGTRMLLSGNTITQ
jgi:hypothetical protein